MVAQKPDIYLDELRELLAERSGIQVHESTIWRALTRSGFTMKKV
jgi:transposase